MLVLVLVPLLMPQADQLKAEADALFDREDYAAAAVKYEQARRTSGECYSSLVTEACKHA
jgi:hypothetical protein